MIRHAFVAAASMLMFVSLGLQIAIALEWGPVDLAELAQKAPIVEKDADVEGIFWDVRIEGIEVHNYIRLKIFTERGKEKWSTVAIPYVTDVKDIDGRTIKPDGSIVELKKDAIFERTLASVRNFKLKSKSFAMPAVELGAIIEYRWTEIHPFDLYAKYYLQREIPLQSIRYHLKAGLSSQGGMHTAPFNCPQFKWEQEPNDFLGFQLRNVAAVHEEPQMPPEDSVRAFFLVFYSSNATKKPNEYWNELGKTRYGFIKEALKPNGKIKETTAKVIGKSSDPDEMISKIFAFVRSNVTNLNDDASELSPEEREKALRKSGAAEALKQGRGSASDIALLFGSMAIAAGLDARIAFTGDRSNFFFDPAFTDTYFLNNAEVVVKVGNAWKFYDPSNAYLPMGMLTWGEEGNSALIPDDKESVFITTPLSPPDKSQEKRSAKLRLSEDGTIEGDIVIEFNGHLGAYRKERDDNSSPAEREENLKNMVKERLSTAEFTNIQIENVTSMDNPFTYRFRIRVPGYAQRTGRRLFIQPAFFQKGIGPLFTTDQRKHDVYFSYPWSEIDDVEIILPEGYTLESPERPQPIDAGQVAQHELKMTISNDHRLLRCYRNFFFGGGNKIFYSVKEYPAVKQFFDMINAADSHTITLRQTAAAQ